MEKRTTHSTQFSMLFYKSMSIILTVVLLALGAQVWAQELSLYDDKLTDVFELGYPGASKGDFQFSKTYTPTDSEWFVSDYFSDSLVFDAQLKFDSKKNASSSYQMRIGKGGQVYSFRGSFGESVPPQWRNGESKLAKNGGGPAYAPWVDDVWQMVATDNQLNDAKSGRKYFIHQAGVYLKTPEQTHPFYSPQLAAYYDAEKEQYTTINWGLQAHTDDNERTGYTSRLLYYTRYTNKGDGIIQVDCMLYNFGSDTLNHLNVPWGGVRESSLQHLFISNPKQGFEMVQAQFGEGKSIKTRDTGGWVAFSSDAAGDAPALGLVYPVDESRLPDIMRYGTAGSVKNRDYHVFSIIKRVGNSLTSGKSMTFRYFFVVGNSVDEIKEKTDRYNLSAYSTPQPGKRKESDIKKLSYVIVDGQVRVSTDSKAVITLYSQPVQGAMPVFYIQSKEGKGQITSNPNYYSSKPFDGKTKSLKLLGFSNKGLNQSVN
ncbi:hypothetical protein N7E81_01890 [Reichenbachiella carrageenanivorans]|uniref:Uncharacterized protein n=1 Tax=Reichenbachiella carrageenanivorans TaxID=2979869 RepID=A0ABY6D121_9BACT|nr:hypothetical protein [Reichenbachiella carrageenanivorans]UXX79856.1 hypothetical protein N7E81_01890 [Reichenbachiella carrageenanivorans]